MRARWEEWYTTGPAPHVHSPPPMVTGLGESVVPRVSSIRPGQAALTSLTLFLAGPGQRAEGPARGREGSLGPPAKEQLRPLLSNTRESWVTVASLLPGQPSLGSCWGGSGRGWRLSR